MTNSPEYRREWSEKNKNKIAAYNRKYQQANRAKINEYKKRWRLTHKETPNKERRRQNSKRWRDLHINQSREASRLRHRRNAIDANEVYLRQWLNKDGVKNPPHNLVLALQTYIKLKRYITYGDSKKHRRIKNAIA